VNLSLNGYNYALFCKENNSSGNVKPYLENCHVGLKKLDYILGFHRQPSLVA